MVTKEDRARMVPMATAQAPSAVTHWREDAKTTMSVYVEGHSSSELDSGAPLDRTVVDDGVTIGYIDCLKEGRGRRLHGNVVMETARACPPNFRAWSSCGCPVPKEQH
jgi:hypothetical protein